MIAELEAPYDRIKMVCTSPVEREKRITAVSKEKETVAWIESLPTVGTYLCDVGANCGAYSLIAASRGIPVTAFEPHGPTFDHLLTNIHLNHLGDKIHAHMLALGAADGRTGMRYSSDDPGAALHELVAGDTHEVYRLDSLIRMGFMPCPTVIKLDVDGGEVGVLRGAEETLKVIQAIQIEVDDESPDDAALIFALLHAAGLYESIDTRHGQTSIRNVLFTREA